MSPVSDELSVLAFRISTRAEDSVRWTPGSRLLVKLDDGGGRPPAELSWATEDGTRWAVGLSPGAAGLYGHRRTADGAVSEVRGEFDGQHDSARIYEFDTQVEADDAWQAAGPLRLLVDDGGGTPVRWLAWRDESGSAYSVAMRPASPTGDADVTELVESVLASAEHSRAGEGASNLVEISTRKWFAPHDRASLEFRLSRPARIDRYILTSANDAPDRDPGTWTLLGSVDGRGWRTLDARTGQSFARRHQSATYSIAEPGAYDRYRLEIAASNGSPHLQLQTIRLLADGSGRFVGYRRRVGQAPVAYRGVHVAQALPGLSLEPQAASAFTPGAATVSWSAPRAAGARGSEWDGWQAGGSWLPLGGSLAHRSITSPSGRFTAMHSMYDVPLAVRDNLTLEWVRVGEVPHSSVLSLGPDGDFVAWDHHGNRLWSSGTAWRGVRRLELRDTGELALTAADGSVVWSSAVPDLPAAVELAESQAESESQAEARAARATPRTAARGSTMRRGESLYRQTLTSDDGSTLLFQDGRRVWIGLRGETSHWDRHYDEQQTVLALDQDGYLRSRTLDGDAVEQIAGPGAELTVVRGRAELRDEAGGVVWASRTQRVLPVREPAMPQSDDLAAWFAALVGEHAGYCVAVVKQSTPDAVLERVGVAPGSVFEGTWRELQRHRDATEAGAARLVAALAVGPDVLILSDDADLPVTTLAPSTSVAALQLPHGGDGYGSVFTLHRDGTLVSEMRDEPRRVKGANVPEVAAALEELTHYLHRHELLFRTVEVVPSAAELGGRLLGGVLAPRLLPSTPSTPPASSTSETAEPPLVLEGWEYGSLDPFVVRTDFTDEDTWNRVVEQLRLPWADDEEGQEPYLILDRRFDGATPEQVLEGVRTAMPEEHLPEVVFIADATAMREKGNPLLVVTTDWDGNPFEEDEEAFLTQYRSLPDAAIEISANLGLGNMDFEDFAGDGPHERMWRS